MLTASQQFIQAELDGIRARMAAFTSAPAGERAANQQRLMAEEELRHQRRVSARAAYLSGRKAPRRRRPTNPLPEPSRQYVTMATTAVRDKDLPRMAASVLTYICALAGTAGYTDATNRALGTALDRSRSTIKRAVAVLVERGYLEHRLIHTARGSVKCRRLTPTDLAWPYWHPKRKNPHEHCGSINAPHITIPLKGESNEAQRIPDYGRRRGGAVRVACGKLADDG